jgi:uncharacterized protein YkwD
VQFEKCENDYQRAMIDMHNKFRNIHNVPPLKTLNSLQYSAFQQAERNSESEFLEYPTDQKNVGVNLAMKGGHVDDCYNIGVDNFNLWYQGESEYDYKTGGFTKETGSFTQLVWNATKHLGCGVSIKNDQAYGLCYYKPAGNIISKFQKNVFPPKNIHIA